MSLFQNYIDYDDMIIKLENNITNRIKLIDLKYVIHNFSIRDIIYDEINILNINNDTKLENEIFRISTCINNIIFTSLVSLYEIDDIDNKLNYKDIQDFVLRIIINELHDELPSFINDTNEYTDDEE